MLTRPKKEKITINIIPAALYDEPEKLHELLPQIGDPLTHQVHLASIWQMYSVLKADMGQPCLNPPPAQKN
uniref:Uncharacterized protein n=1 Tax=Sphaeramia orbicularis TaxID=375764 RepID=A0A672YI98_9TELE